MEQLKQLKEGYSLIYDVRGLGLLVAVVLRRPDGSPVEPEAEQIMYGALSKGLSFKVTTGSTLALIPPLNILEDT
jgi:4-aminobutyrate aminotransferase